MNIDTIFGKCKPLVTMLSLIGLRHIDLLGFSFYLLKGEWLIGLEVFLVKKFFFDDLVSIIGGGAM